MFAVVTPEKIQLPPGAVVRLPGTWQDYRALSQQLGDRSIPRIKYRPGEILQMRSLSVSELPTSVILAPLFGNCGGNWGAKIKSHWYPAIGNNMNALTLNLHPVIELTDEQFEQLAAANQDLRLEKTAQGKLIIMPPTGGNTGKRNTDLLFQLQAWNRQNQLGVVFDSSTAFRLPKGATLSPDASWVSQSRWDELTPREQDSFPPLCPDFVVELRSRTDSIEELQTKMQEYLENGIRLGWLINPKTRTVEIYHPSQAKEVLQSPQSLSGEDVLPGFVLDLQPIFD